MRRTLALMCGAAYLALGSLAALAHVHGAADHHAEARGLHLDHAHLPGVDAHDRSGQRSTTDVEATHADHHDGDAVYLNASAARVLESTRVLPAVACAAVTIESPSRRSPTLPERPNAPRGPPEGIPPRLRAPPA